MGKLPFSKEILDKELAEAGITSVKHASIRQIVRLVNALETNTGTSFFRMEMGVPGVQASKVGVDAEIEALKAGVASKYPLIEGVPELKHEISRFVKLFLNEDVRTEGCLPTVGSMQGAFATFLTTCRCNKNKDTVLFIDPGFPVQKSQLKVLGLKFESFDVYKYRGNKLSEKLESYLKKGTISTIIYSNPNNPSWVCFTESELKQIGELANKYDTIVVEDLAYFGMDFRKNYGKPGEAPFQPSVVKYTDNYILLISSSKVFSYAGQRIASLVVSDSLFKREFPDLENNFSSSVFGNALVYGALYALSSGTSHSGQYALAAMLQAANDGIFLFLDSVKIYGERAKKMKQCFIKHGFNIVYDKDEDKELADGFYFTVEYKGMTGEQLLYNLLLFGISAISLDITGSENKDGIRACTSMIETETIPELESRLSLFNEMFR